MYYRFELFNPNPLILNDLIHLAPDTGEGPLHHVLVKGGGLCNYYGTSSVMRVPDILPQVSVGSYPGG